MDPMKQRSKRWQTEKGMKELIKRELESSRVPGSRRGSTALVPESFPLATWGLGDSFHPCIFFFLIQLIRVFFSTRSIPEQIQCTWFYIVVITAL